MRTLLPPLRGYGKRSSAFQRKATKENSPSGDGLFSLVSHVDITWNSFLPYLTQLTDKLETLGFRYVDDKVIVLQEETDEK